VHVPREQVDNPRQLDNKKGFISKRNNYEHNESFQMFEECFKIPLFIHTTKTTEFKTFGVGYMNTFLPLSSAFPYSSTANANCY